ncbi:MAG: hypothetical protein KDK38_16790, partial [Leptospiraceae bacterium]|nr:hypothetical protein [Leptospiraceae bacterium]
MPVKAATQKDYRQLLQLAEYIDADYQNAVSNHEVISTEEYQEMQEFASILVKKTQALHADSKKLPDAVEAASLLLQSVIQKDTSDKISKLSSGFRQAILKHSSVIDLPGSLVSRKKSQLLFEQHCSACHGTE